MKKLVLLLILSLSIQNSYSQNVSLNEMYTFLVWEVKNSKKLSIDQSSLSKKRVYYKFTKWESENFIEPEDKFELRLLYLFKEKNQLDSIFNENDKTYLLHQFQKNREETWTKRKLKIRFTSNDKKKNTYYYSIPLFSLDKKYVIVRKQFHCGDSCFQGGFFIYRKIANDKWIFIKSINNWLG